MLTLLWKKHWFAIVFSLIVGAVYVAPNVAFLGTAGHSLPLMYTDAESLYLSRINAVYKGCVSSCNPYIREYGSMYPFFDASIEETILALPGVIFKIPAVRLKVVYEFLLPSVLFLLMYSFVYRITFKRHLSLIAGALLLFGYNLFNATDLINISDILNLFRLVSDHNQFLLYARPVNPQLSSIVFLVYLHCCLSALRKKTVISYLILAAVYGFSFYTYFFLYAFISVVQFVLFIVVLCKKEWREAQRIFFATLCGIIIGSPVLYEIVVLFRHPFFSTIPTEYLLKSHVPYISMIGVSLLITFVAVVLIYVKKYGRLSSDATMITALVIAAFVLVNEHVITGMIMQYDHFERYYFTPVLIIALCFFLNVFSKEEYSGISKILMSIICIGITLNGLLIQHASYRHFLPIAERNERYASILTWLAKEGRPGSVIAAPEQLSGIIPVFTNDYVLWTFYARQWMSVPGRMSEVLVARKSAHDLLKVGRKYEVDYYIEEVGRDIFAKHQDLVDKIFEDGRFVVYNERH